MDRCPNCYMPKPTDPAVLAQHQTSVRHDPRCLCHNYCFVQGDEICREEREVLEYRARLLKYRSFEEYVVDLLEDEGDQVPRAAADPRYGDCRNCNRPVHLPVDEGGCLHKMKCEGFSTDKMAELKLLDGLVMP